MAMKIDSSLKSDSVKVQGDLGDLQITEISDSEEDLPKNNHNAQKSINTKPNIPSSLLHKTSVPVFGSVSVSNSENVHFGNATYFTGPVTIKQIVNNKSGVENQSYSKTEENENVEENLEKKLDTPINDHQILLWHKLTFAAVCISVIGGIIAIVLVLQTKTEPQTSTSSSSAESDFTKPESPLDTLVIGYCYENFQFILIWVIVFSLTFLLIFITHSLLTRQEGRSGMVSLRRYYSHENCLEKNCAICKKADPLLVAPEHIRIVSRTDWLAQPVEGELDKLQQPVPWVIITHTATESCNTQSQCVLRVRLIQTFHIESRGWYDIGYNFLVGGDGSVYFGRGWDYEGAHTKGYNKYSIGIAFIGTFNNDPPPKQQVEACEKIIRQGVQLGKLAKDYKLFAHRQFMSTLSPGDKVFDIIKKWPHFVKNDTNIEDLLPKRG